MDRGGLYPFKNDGKDGTNPVGGLIFDKAGNFYGTTREGGKDDVGTVFRLTPNGNGRWTEEVLYPFKNDGKDGQHPQASLVFDSGGNLYGTTQNGGDNADAGTVFRLTRNTGGSWTENVLHSFGFADDGAYPFSALIFDSSGNLYGTTGYGGPTNVGTVFKLTQHGNGGWTETVLHSFDIADGPSPLQVWFSTPLDASTARPRRAASSTNAPTTDAALSSS